MRARTLAALLFGCALAGISPHAASAADVSSRVVVVDTETGISQVTRRETGRALLTPLAFPADAAQPILIRTADGTAEILDEERVLRRWRAPVDAPLATASPDAQQVLWHTASGRAAGPLAGAPRLLRVRGWAQATDEMAAWAPDSKAVALAATVGERLELRLIEVPGGAERARTALPLDQEDLFPLAGVTPDGRFVVRRTEPQPGVITLVDPLRRSNSTPLPLPDGANLVVWSPDGARGAVNTFHGAVYVTDLGPSGALTPWRRVVAPGPANTEPVEWAPGAPRLLVAVTRLNHPATYQVLATDAESRLVAFDPAGAHERPMWSTDGRRLAYTIQTPPHVGLPRGRDRRDCPDKAVGWVEGLWVITGKTATSPRRVTCDDAGRVVRAYVRGTARGLGWQCHSVVDVTAQVLCRRGARNVAFELFPV